MRKREESGELHQNYASLNQPISTNREVHSEKNNAISLMKNQESSPNSSFNLKQDLSVLLDTVNEALAILDNTGIIQYCNQACVQLLGYTSPAQLQGLSIKQVIADDSNSLSHSNNELIDYKNDGFFPPCKIKKKEGLTVWIDGFSCQIIFQDTPSFILFIRDITNRHREICDLEQLEKKYRTIAELSANGIVTINPLGKITYVNRSFQKMTGIDEDKLTNMMFRELLTKDSIYQFQQLMLQVRKDEKNLKHVEMNINLNQTDYIPVELSIAPVIENQEFTGYICTILDIKERKKFEDEIKKSERLKTEFMNIVAHELKSPVTPIKGYLDLIISDNQADIKIKKWAQIGLRNAERLLLLVNDILDVSRLDNDTMSFEMRKIETSKLFYEIIEDMKPAVQEKQLQFNVAIQDCLPPILGDYHRLSQVLRNLLTNAVKFTDEGSITLKAYTQDNDLILQVIDTGIGMRQDEAEKVFNKFFQAETSENRRHEGTGLGLFICKEIIKKHRGDISVKSDLGKGSMFTIRFPTL